MAVKCKVSTVSILFSLQLLVKISCNIVMNCVTLREKTDFRSFALLYKPAAKIIPKSGLDIWLLLLSSKIFH